MLVINLSPREGLSGGLGELLGELLQEDATAKFQAYRAKRAAEAKRRREEFEAAHQHANKILMEILSPKNRERLATVGVIEITGSAGGRYQISSRGYSGNVFRMEHDFRCCMRLCAHPVAAGTHLMPMSAVVLAQMMHLIVDEPGFLRVARAVCM